MILTVDLGTSVTKVVVWGDDGQVAVGRSPLQSIYTDGNRAEQDPATWWPSVVTACAAARASLGASGPGVFGAVEAIGFAAARQTFVPVAADATPLGPALLWSDRRAGAEAAALAESFGDDGAGDVRRRTGIVLDAGSVAAKVTWLLHHEPHRMGEARWLLAPRDLLAWRLTGEVSTDHTLASATGLYEMSAPAPASASAAASAPASASAAAAAGGAGVLGPVGAVGPLGPLVPGLVDAVADRFPDSRSSDTVLGSLLSGPAAEMGVPSGVPVVIGAGDRACEVLGAQATEAWPMVSWGTTANVSVPVPVSIRPDPTPDAMVVTRGALEGWLLEGGLSAAGSLVDWLVRLAGVDVDSLIQRARSSPPGSRGVIVLPWLGGARAPWWRDTARGALVGLSFDHDVGDMARAVIESVAWDVQRCLESVSARHSAVRPVGLVLGGGAATMTLWTEVLTAVTGLPVRRLRGGEAASVGAAMLVHHATGVAAGVALGVDTPVPIETEISPDVSMVHCYASLRPNVDAAAAAVIDLGR